MKKITKEEFEEKYARLSHMTIERLRELKLIAIPCECDYKLCHGWQMVNKETAKHGV